jgi:peptidoglycan/LPS O-acetylase OafA/YrhL
MLSNFPDEIRYFIPYSNIISLIIEPFFNSLCFIVVLFISTQLVRDHCSFSYYIKKIGSYSFGIYLVHDFFRLFIGNIFFPSLNFNWNLWLYFPVLFLTTLLLSYSFVGLLSHIPWRVQSGLGRRMRSHSVHIGE